MIRSKSIAKGEKHIFEKGTDEKLIISFFTEKSQDQKCSTTIAVRIQTID